MTTMKIWLFCYLLVILACSFAHTLSTSVGTDRDIPRTWCIANPLSLKTNLQRDIAFLCTNVDCSSIRPGGACFNPNTFQNHASVLFNLYYKAHGAQESYCKFGGDAMLSLSDPSYGTCKFE
ncbi:glucan endo-1,3-beta-glucosidase-like [Phoenix dactylifera]|uniref:Glucan endo-1,3-beta-glucosidase-like n=1 Tax=Phoenix dactylifera TaxID=42345 RepID=A0A8B9B2U0_PHODC|nr:glucan endo-1,3-beta-glucosidase-like [Phoenix dactylifera]